MKARDFVTLVLLCGIGLFLLSACEVEEPGEGDAEPKAGYKFVEITAGTYTMGSPEDEAEGLRETDEIEHEVTISNNYWLLETEVTQDQWKDVMDNENPSSIDCPDCPVDNVSYNAVKIFIALLSSEEADGSYRLPTEAEWEFAARAGESTAFPNGDITEFNCTYRDDNLDDIAWYCYNADSIQEVKGKDAIGGGLYDMHGNAMEWVSDWYAAYPEEEVTDPQGPTSGTNKVVRGGSFESQPHLCRSAMRNSFPKDTEIAGLGFRLVWVPDTVE